MRKDKGKKKSQKAEAKKGARTPVRELLVDASFLFEKVKDGLSALLTVDKAYVDEPLRAAFSDSLALDDAIRPGHENENRWDYLLGHRSSGLVFGLEPHSAKQDQITKVIAKRSAAQNHLRGHLKPGKHIAAWFWVASGAVEFANTERARIRLDQSGIQFVGKKLLSKHLEDSVPSR